MHARSTRTLADVRDSFIETEGVSLLQMAPWVVLCKYPPRLPVPCTVFSIRKNFYSSKKRKNFLFLKKRGGEIVKETLKKYHCIIFLHVLVNRWGITFFFFFYSNNYLIFKKLRNVMIILKATHHRKLYCTKISTILNIFIFFLILFFTIAL